MENLVKAKWGTLAIAGLAGLILLGAGGTGAYLYWQSRVSKTPELLTEIEALKHLYAMRNATDQASMNSAELASSNDGSAKGDDSEALGTIYQDFENVLSRYVMTTTYGPKADACPMYTMYGYDMGQNSPEIESYTSDYYSYYSGYNYWSKGVEMLGDDVVITRVSTDEYGLEYLGGDYAIKFIFPENEDPNLKTTEQQVVMEEGESEPRYGDEANDSDVAVAEPTIEDMFGPDAVVEGPVEENGRYYYVVTFEMEGSNCDLIGGMPVPLSSRMAEEGNTGYTNSGVEKVVIKAWVDAEDGMWGRQEVYVDAIADENLVTSIESSSESREAELWEVQGIFTFNEDVEIREYQLPDYVFVEADEKAEIQSADDPVLLLADAVKGSLNLLDIYVTEYNYAQYSYPTVYEDRAFFPDGEIGDFLYESYNSTYSGGLYQISKTGAYYTSSVCNEGGQEGCVNVTIDVFSEDPENYDLSGAKDITVYLDGSAIAAKLIDGESLDMTTTKCVSSQGSNITVCEEEAGKTTPWNSYIISFSRGEYYFQVSISGYSITESQARGYNRLETLDVDDDSLVDALVEEIEAGRGYSGDDVGGSDGQPAIVEE